MPRHNRAVRFQHETMANNNHLGSDCTDLSRYLQLDWYIEDDISNPAPQVSCFLTSRPNKPTSSTTCQSRHNNDHIKPQWDRDGHVTVQDWNAEGPQLHFWSCVVYATDIKHCAPPSIIPTSRPLQCFIINLKWPSFDNVWVWIAISA